MEWPWISFVYQTTSQNDWRSVRLIGGEAIAAGSSGDIRALGFG